MAFIRVRIKVSFRSSYVTCILITKLTFVMFLPLKLNTLSAAIFLFVSLVLSLLCGAQQEFFIIVFFFCLYSLSADVDIRH